MKLKVKKKSNFSNLRNFLLLFLIIIQMNKYRIGNRVYIGGWGGEGCVYVYYYRRE
jgi:hypothetical protein